MGKPLMSIITPSYNRGHLLPRAWLSLEKQTFRNFEWIIVDDGSTDNTPKVVSSLSGNFIRYIRVPNNRGVNAARNRGIFESEAPYLVFLDSDDELTYEALEVIFEEWKHLDNKQVGKIAFRGKDAHTDHSIGYMKDQRLELEYKDIICEELVKGNFLQTTRREVFSKSVFPEDIQGLEALLWWRFAKNWKELYINKTLLICHSANDQLTGVESSIRHADSMAQGYTRLCDDHRQGWLAHCPAQYGRYLIVNALYQALAGHRGKAVSNTLKGLKWTHKKIDALALLSAALCGKRITQFLFRMRAYLRQKNG